MTPESWVVFGGWFAAGVGVIWGFFQKFNKQHVRSDTIAAADAAAIISGKDELIKVQTERAETWKAQFDREHDAREKDREYHHAKLEESNATVLKYTSEVVELRAKTDLSPIHDKLEKQDTINTEMLNALKAISETLITTNQTIQVLVQKITGERA